MNDLKSIYRQDDIVLSPSDSPGLLWMGRKITKPFFEISSAVLDSRKYEIIKKEYSHANRIIIDKIIENSEYREKVFNALNRLKLYGIMSSRYLNIIDQMQLLVEEMKFLKTFKKCGSTKHFTVYCRA